MTTPSPLRRSRRWRSMALGLLALGTMTGSAFLGSGPAAAAPEPAPVPADCQVIDFRTATVDPLVSPDPANQKYQLTVTGVLPQPAKVSLELLTYVRRPEHWGIEVVACSTFVSRAGDLPVMPPPRIFKTTLTFQGPLGTCGIDIIGATRHQTFDLAGPPGCEAIGPRI